MKALTVPALVVGGGLNGLGVARSLGAAGVPVYLLEARTDDPALASRYVRALRASALAGEPLLATLERLGRERFRGQRPVLLFTQEHSVSTLASSQAQARLALLYRFLSPSAEVLQALLRKTDFAVLAADAGLPVPKTVRLRGLVDLERALALRFPVVLKPAWHDPAYIRSGLARAYRAETPDEARRRIEDMQRVLPEVVAQEWVEGGDEAIHFCLQHLCAEGRPLATFVGRKLRSWPPRIGGTAACVPAPEARVLAERTARFFARLRVRGLAGMEYKLNAQGEYLAIEPTIGRSDYQEEVATLNGVNLPLAYYLDTLGRGCEYRDGPARRIVWVDEEAERRSALAQGLAPRRWARADGPVRGALWRLRDPMPWLALRARRLAARLGRA